jgi:hypothetical protein
MTMADQPQPTGAGESAESSDPAESTEYSLNDVVACARDIVLYAPIALVLDAPDLLPKLARQGKQHMRNARALGPHALRKIQNRLLSTAETVGDQAGGILRQFGLVPDDGADGRDGAGPASTSSRPATRRARPEPAAGNHRSAVDVSENGTRPAAPPSPAVDELAIPDYDSLSALQVVDRLPGLTSDELEAVRAYEAAHRGRKTILNKAAQLQA